VQTTGAKCMRVPENRSRPDTSARTGTGFSQQTAPRTTPLCRSDAERGTIVVDQKPALPVAPALVSSNGVAEVLTNPRLGRTTEASPYGVSSSRRHLRSLPHTTPPKRGPIRVTWKPRCPTAPGYGHSRAHTLHLFFFARRAGAICGARAVSRRRHSSS